MADQSYSITFEGYWMESKKDNIPSKSGIYGVFSGIYNKEKNQVNLQKLIYIGESVDVKARIANHEKLQDWERHINEGEEIFYSFGAAPEASRNRCEAAIIFQHKPPENTEYAEAFPFDKTNITIDGVVAFLERKFTVERK
ncbi:GIY-YIG nuclease family protein [Ralstonia nicotianae]